MLHPATGLSNGNKIPVFCKVRTLSSYILQTCFILRSGVLQIVFHGRTSKIIFHIPSNTHLRKWKQNNEAVGITRIANCLRKIPAIFRGILKLFAVHTDVLSNPRWESTASERIRNISYALKDPTTGTSKQDINLVGGSTGYTTVWNILTNRAATVSNTGTMSVYPGLWRPNKHKNPVSHPPNPPPPQDKVGLILSRKTGETIRHNQLLPKPFSETLYKSGTLPGPSLTKRVWSQQHTYNLQRENSLCMSISIYKNTPQPTISGQTDEPRDTETDLEGEGGGKTKGG
jgi:hypothetical protein